MRLISSSGCALEDAASVRFWPKADNSRTEENLKEAQSAYKILPCSFWIAPSLTMIDTAPGGG